MGSKGDLDSHWSYDAYYQYGRSNYTQVYSNEFSVARLNRALNVVDDPRTPGFDPICRSVLDGSDPTCVPYNVFAGAGGASAASVAYLSATGFQKGQTSEQIVSASVTGLLGDYGLKTPWADDGFAVNLGVEYRKESLELQTDNAFSTGDLTGQGGATLPLSGNFHVFEFFGETQIPIVHDSLFYDLSLNAGYRHSSYATSANAKYETDTWKIGLDFAPIRDIRFRGSYNRAARAPNIQELFATQTVALDGSVDPCSGHKITATEYGCIAQGIPVGQGTASNPAAQYNGLIGGVPTLTPEIATTKTIGVVFQPSFFPRFSMTVDYFDIKVRNSISQFGSDAIVNDCVAKSTATTVAPSCSLIHRDPAHSIWLTPGGFVTDLPNNIGSLQTKGIEVNANFTQPLGFATLSLSLIGTYLRNYIVDTASPPSTIAPASTGRLQRRRHHRERRAVAEVAAQAARDGCSFPDGLGVSLQWRYIDSVTAETTTSNGTLHGDFNFNPGLHIQPYSYFDLSGSFALGDHYNFRLGVNNLLDKSPPFVTTGSGSRAGSSLCPTGPCNGNTYPATYDALGRYIYAGITLDF